MSLLNGLDISVQGVSAQTNRLSSIGNNIANTATTGYKATDVAFETLLGDQGAATYAGSGVQSALRLNASSQGTITATDTSTNLAVSGQGYFVVETTGGATALTRAGAFTRQANGTLVNTAGDTLLGYGAGGAALAPVVVPAGALSTTVASNGALSITTANGTATSASIPLAQVRSPENMTALTADDYQANSQSGTMSVATAGTDGLGTIVGSSVENSTADLATQLTDMIVTQRSYEANSKVMQATSDMLSKLSNL